MRATAGLPGRFQAVDGLKLAYEVRGHGEPLVLARKVVAIELQGHGHRPDIDRRQSYREMAKDVGGILGAHDITNNDVFEFSMGGSVRLQQTLQQELYPCASIAGSRPSFSHRSAVGTDP